MASYTCDPQYAVVGVKELVCTENGIWSGTFLGCRINGNYDVLYFFKHMLFFFFYFFVLLFNVFKSIVQSI